MTRARRGTIAARTGSRVGTTIVDRMKQVQAAAECKDRVHPASKAMTLAGADNVRRRLSSIFQRPISGSALEPRLPRDASPRPKIQGSNCQSPRAQRC